MKIGYYGGVKNKYSQNFNNNDTFCCEGDPKFSKHVPVGNKFGQICQNVKVLRKVSAIGYI